MMHIMAAPEACRFGTAAMRVYGERWGAVRLFHSMGQNAAMQITRFTDYAIRVLTYCALRDGGLATTQEIAERYGISTNHLVKVVQELSRHGYLAAARGKGGGIRLARPPEQINLGELIGRLEEMELAECFGSGNACRITPACRMAAILAEARAAFLAALSRHTLAEVVQPHGELRALLAMPEA